MEYPETWTCVGCFVASLVACYDQFIVYYYCGNNHCKSIDVIIGCNIVEGLILIFMYRSQRGAKGFWGSVWDYPMKKKILVYIEECITEAKHLWQKN